MKHSHPSVLCLAAALAGVLIPARLRADDPELLFDAPRDDPPPVNRAAPVSERPRVGILRPVVNLNGVSRPDLAQSLSDCIAAQLLQTGVCEVLDLEFAAAVQKRPRAEASAGTPLALPIDHLTGNAGGIGRAAGADLLLVPTVVAEANRYHLTMKKLRVATGVIEGVAREAVTGTFDVLDVAAASAVAILMPPPPRRIAYIKAWMNPPPPKPAPSPAPRAAETPPRALPVLAVPPARLAAIESAKREAWRLAALSGEPVSAGRISHVDAQWSFCVIHQGKGVKLKVGDHLITWSARAPDRITDLTVTGLEQGRVIADIPAGNAALLQHGDRVYAWAAPVSPSPRPATH